MQVTLLGEAGSAAVAGPVAGSGVRVDPTLTISGAAADAKVVGETLRTVTVTVNEKLQAASDDTNAKLDKLKKSISRKRTARCGGMRHVGRGECRSAGGNGLCHPSVCREHMAQ